MSVVFSADAVIRREKIQRSGGRKYLIFWLSNQDAAVNAESKLFVEGFLESDAEELQTWKLIGLKPTLG